MAINLTYRTNNGLHYVAINAGQNVLPKLINLANDLSNEEVARKFKLEDFLRKINVEFGHFEFTNPNLKKLVTEFIINYCLSKELDISAAQINDAFEGGGMPKIFEPTFKAGVDKKRQAMFTNVNTAMVLRALDKETGKRIQLDSRSLGVPIAEMTDELKHEIKQQYLALIWTFRPKNNEEIHDIFTEVFEEHVRDFKRDMTSMRNSDLEIERYAIGEYEIVGPFIAVSNDKPVVNFKIIRKGGKVDNHLRTITRQVSDIPFAEFDPRNIPEEAKSIIESVQSTLLREAKKILSNPLEVVGEYSEDALLQRISHAVPRHYKGYRPVNS